jgi:hypothetical protein
MGKLASGTGWPVGHLANRAGWPRGSIKLTAAIASATWLRFVTAAVESIPWFHQANFADVLSAPWLDWADCCCGMNQVAVPG